MKPVDIVHKFKWFCPLCKRWNEENCLPTGEVHCYGCGEVYPVNQQSTEKADVGFYRDRSTGEILPICKECFNREPFCHDYTYIDRAGDDICVYCETQNVPANYRNAEYTK